MRSASEIHIFFYNKQGAVQRVRGAGDGCGCSRVVCRRVCGCVGGGGTHAISAVCATAPAASACPVSSQFSCATRAVDVAWKDDRVKHEEGLSSSQVSLHSSSFAHQL